MRSDPPEALADRLASATPARRPGVQCHELDGEAVLYDQTHHALHYLNATAHLIWTLCDGKTPAAAMPVHITAAFDVPMEEQIARDTHHTLIDLAANGLIDWRPTPA